MDHQDREKQLSLARAQVRGLEAQLRHTRVALYRARKELDETTAAKNRIKEIIMNDFVVPLEECAEPMPGVSTAHRDEAKAMAKLVRDLIEKAESE